MIQRLTFPRVKRFARNTLGRDLIAGDVHGCFTRLQAALNAIGFDRSRDRLFLVGDLVDRGPESPDALKWLEWVHAVSGNHEQMAIDWADGIGDSGIYAANGGAWNIGNTLAERRMYADAFAALPIAIEIETESGPVGIVHAECPFASWPQFLSALEDPAVSAWGLDGLINAAQWSRDRIQHMDDSQISGVRAVVVGHTPMDRWTSLGNTLFIDTMGWRHGTFTILDAATLKPATPRGAIRQCAHTSRQPAGACTKPHGVITSSKENTE